MKKKKKTMRLINTNSVWFRIGSSTTDPYNKSTFKTILINFKESKNETEEKSKDKQKTGDLYIPLVLFDSMSMVPNHTLPGLLFTCKVK